MQKNERNRVRRQTRRLVDGAFGFCRNRLGFWNFAFLRSVFDVVSIGVGWNKMRIGEFAGSATAATLAKANAPANKAASEKRAAENNATGQDDTPVSSFRLSPTHEQTQRGTFDRRRPFDRTRSTLAHSSNKSAVTTPRRDGYSKFPNFPKLRGSGYLPMKDARPDSRRSFAKMHGEIGSE